MVSLEHSCSVAGTQLWRGWNTARVMVEPKIEHSDNVAEAQV